MPENQSLEGIVSILEKEKETARIFLEILHKEEEALIQERVNDLDRIVSEKHKIITELEAINVQRSQYLLSQGYPASKVGMQQWLTKYADDIELHELWNQLIILAKQANQINQINGRAILLQLQYNQRSYLALQSAAGNIFFYGPKGQAYI
ncbi:MAG: flagellar protein FlgN [Nitrosomonas sp.]|nr:flagellar protein FlgN [Nitrosomonas sp.]